MDPQFFKIRPFHEDIPATETQVIVPARDGYEVWVHFIDSVFVTSANATLEDTEGDVFFTHAAAVLEPQTLRVTIPSSVVPCYKTDPGLGVQANNAGETDWELSITYEYVWVGVPLQPEPPPLVETLRLTMAGGVYSDLQHDWGARDGILFMGMGSWGALSLDGVSLTHYFFPVISGPPADSVIGVDPGLSEPALASVPGRLPILATAGFGGAFPSVIFMGDLAAELATAGFDVSHTPGTSVIDIVQPAGSPAFLQGGAWADRAGAFSIGAGLRGWQSLVSGGNANSAQPLAVNCIPASALPSNPYRIVGFGILRGTNVTGQFRIAVWQGGASDTDQTGATLVLDCGPTLLTVAGATEVRCRPLVGLPGLPTVGQRLWVGLTADPGSGIRFENTGGANFATSNFNFVGALNRVVTGGPSGSGAVMPATLAGTSSTSGNFPAIYIIVQEEPYWGDFAWQTMLGSPNLDFAALTTTTAAEGIFVGNRYVYPTVRETVALSMWIAYQTHVVGDDYRAAIYDASLDAAPDNFDDEVLLWDFGQSSGSATGWVEYPEAGLVSGVEIDVPPTFVRLMFISDFTLNESELRFDAGQVSAANPWRYYSTSQTVMVLTNNESECEVQFPDPMGNASIPATTPVNATTAFIQADNSVGIAALIGCRGLTAEIIP